MDFGDNLKALSEKIIKYKDRVTNEEMTKTAFVMPFFELLGYDTRNPFEFMPEFTADIGDSKGEKVDYAIILNDETQILIEAKPCNDNLEKHDKQLMRYFHASNAKIGILTNGIIYKFFTDLEEKNKMDTKPFLEIDLLNIRDNEIAELKKFFKSNFDINNILSTAEILKYSNSIKKLIISEFEEPSDNFVTFILSEIYDGQKNQKVKDKFRDIIKKSINQVINDMVRNKLEGALSKNEDLPAVEESVTEDIPSTENTIVTTAEELEGYGIVKSILHEFIPDISKIEYKDTQSYFGILYEGNIRKWICRLYFNTANKYISFPEFDESGAKINEKKIQINNLNDIYKYKKELKASVNNYLN